MAELVLAFRDSEGKKRAIRLSNYSPDLTSDEIKRGMNGISDSRVVGKDGVDYYATPIDATFTELIETKAVVF